MDDNVHSAGPYDDPAVGSSRGMLKKNSMLSMLGQSLIVMGVVTIIWVVSGFPLHSVRTPGADRQPGLPPDERDWGVL